MAKKRIFAAMLAMCMVLSLLPATVFAAEGEKQTLPEQLLASAGQDKIDDANDAAQDLIDDTFNALNPPAEGQAPAEDKKVEDVSTKGEDGNYTAKGDVLTEAGEAKDALEAAKDLVEEAEDAKTLAGKAEETAQGALVAAKDKIGDAANAAQTAENAKTEAETAAGEAAETAKEAAGEIEADTEKAEAVENALTVETEDGEKKTVAEVIGEQQQVINQAVSEAASAAANGDVEGATAAQAKAQDAVDTANGVYEQAQNSFVDAVKDILGEEAFAEIQAPAEDAGDDAKAAYNNALIQAAQNALQSKYNGYNQTISDANGKIDDANTAIGNANTAIGNANTAIGNANTAIGNANTAIGNANTAVDAANTAINGTEGANAKVAAAVEKLEAAQQALAAAQAKKAAAEAAKNTLDAYVKILEGTQANPDAVEDLKKADRELTDAKKTTDDLKKAADALESGDSKSTTGERLVRDSNAFKNGDDLINKTDLQLIRAIEVAGENASKIEEYLNLLEQTTDENERKNIWNAINSAKENIFDNSTGLTVRSPYQFISERLQNSGYGYSEENKTLLNRLIANMNVLEKVIIEQDKQEAYNKTEQELKEKLTGKDVKEEEVIAAVKALGELQKANEALAKHQQEAEDAQAKVDSALKAYEAAKNAVEDVLDQLTTDEGKAIHLETQNKLASMIELGTLNDIEKIKEDLKNQGIEDTQVNGVLSQLSAALAALENAKTAKDEAEKAKEEADQAVRDAEERRQEIEDSIGGGTGGDDTGDTDIPDTDVPMVEGPDAGDTDTGVEIEDLEVPLTGVATRGEFLNYLYEHEGAPETELSTFADVPADHPYAKAIGWAQAKGLVVGYGDGNFGPDDPVNYSAVRIILTKYAAYLNIEMPELATLAGEDNSPVFNCTDVLAEFFGE